MIPTRLLLALSATLALAACVSADEASYAADPSLEKPPAVEPNPPPNEGEVMKCDDTQASWAIGKLADEALIARVRSETHSKGVRVIKPGMAVTMDYREDRVNIDVDANGHVLKIRCG